MVAKDRKVLWLAVSSAVLGLGSVARPELAHAQAADETAQLSTREGLTEVVVTGSRLRDPNVQAANPLTIIDQVQLEQLAPLSLEATLERMPGASIKSQSGNSSAGSQGDGGFIDLHQLSYARTLVLIDGRRATPTMIASSLGTIAVNVSTIPLTMIDHVEILKDGASPVYGTDAIGGVVNIVLKESFDGFGGTVQLGAAEQGDRESGRVSTLAGKMWERGDFMVGLDYNRREAAYYQGRSEYSALVNSIGQLPNGDIGFTSMNRIVTPGGVAQLPNGQRFTFTEAGVYRPYSPSDNVPIDPRTMMAPESENFTVMPRARYFITDDVTAHFEGMFTNQKTDYRSSNHPALPTIPASNPFNPFGVPVTLHRSMFPDAGYPGIETEQDTYRAVAGLEGSFAEGRFHWNLDYVWGRSQDSITNDNSWNTQKLANALDPVRCAAAPGCVLANLFGPGTLTPEAIAYFQTRFTADNQYDQRIVSGSIDGSLFELPAGPVTAAVGFDARKDSGYTHVSEEQKQGFSPFGPADDTEGSFRTTEAYVELGIPVLTGHALAKSLSLNFATRHSHYSNFGDTTNWKAGLNWAFDDQIRLRANRATGFRAPNIAELFGAMTARNNLGVTLLDPCSATSRASNPAYSAGCDAAGVPADFVPPAGSPTAIIRGGNENVQPETSRSANIGLVLTPHWIPNFTASVDYYRVDLEDTISPPDPVYMLQQCYLSGASLSDPFCSLISRNDDGTLNQILNIYTNIGKVETDGFDFSLNYRLKLAHWDDPGTLAFNLEGNYLDDYLIQNQAGGEIVQQAGKLVTGPENGLMPRLRANLTTTYSRDEWSVGWAVRMSSAVRVLESQIDAVGGIDTFAEIPATYYHDLFGQFTAPSPVGDVKITAGLQNVFDKKAPFTFPRGQYIFGLYDSIGRFGYLKASVGF